MKVITRGTEVTFSTIFYDTSGDAISPSAANLYISYPSAGYPLRSTGLESTTATLTMNSTTFEWTGNWDSSVSQPGTVFWHVRSSSGQSAEDGHFEVRGNLANLSVPTSS